MSDVYLIEVDGSAVGLVSLDNDGLYRFHAAVPKMNQIDGRSFPTPDLAQRAARRVMRERLAPPAAHPPKAA